MDWVVAVVGALIIITMAAKGWLQSSHQIGICVAIALTGLLQGNQVITTVWGMLALTFFTWWAILRIKKSPI